MNQNEKKRAQIFNKFSQQWEILKQNNLLRGYSQKYVGNYICPICLEHFSPKDLNQKLPNPLTLEDAPPKSLGGKANTLTCKKCNNNLGTQIDSHLHYRLNEIDKKKFLPNTESKVKVKMGDKIVQGTVLVDEHGTITMFHTSKNNHKERLDEFIKRIDPNSENPFVTVEFPMGKVDLEKLQFALLKSAYLLVFEKFGYLFILDKVYDRLREQLLNPNKKIYPTKFWFEPPFPKSMCGVHFITDKGMESILVVFLLKTNNTERIIGAMLPLPFNKIDDIISELNRRFSKKERLNIECSAFDPQADSLSEIGQMKDTLNLIEEMKMNH